MISFLTKAAKEIPVDKKQACRFMGCRDENISGAFAELYDECLSKYLSVAELKAVVRKSAIAFSEGNKIQFDFGIIESESLKKNLHNCRSAYIFAATAGSEVDRTIKRLCVSSEAEGMIFSCIASSGVDCFCDFINEEMAKKHKLRPRFSPGYGDVPLSVQPAILDYLEAGKRIGITLTESLMMVPVKSVTAIVGILEEER